MDECHLHGMTPSTSRWELATTAALVPLIDEGDTEGRGSAAEPDKKHHPPAKSQDLSVGHYAPVVPAVVPTKMHPPPANP